MELGVDSASTPTASEAAAAAHHGIKWWGGYIGGSSASNVWSPSGWSALRQAGIEPVPIWVPDQSFTENPVQQAHLAIRACQRAGLDGPIVLDTENSATGDPHLKSFVNAWNRTIHQAGRTSVIYDGAGYHGDGVAWLPSWGPDHRTGAGSAKQYAGATPRWGVQGGVDLDVAGRRFPFDPASRRSHHGARGATGGSPTRRGGAGGRTGRVVVSPPELASLATLLKESEERVVSVHRQATSLLADLLDSSNGAGGAGTAEVQQAVTILERITGPGVDGLSHLVGSLWQGEAYVRRVRAQALHADQGGGSLTPGQAALLRTLRRDGVDRRTLAKVRAEMLARDRKRHGTVLGGGHQPDSGRGTTTIGGPAHHRSRQDHNGATAAEHKLVDDAKRWLGVPYRYGGTSKSGVDCSGLTQAVYAKMGIHIGRDTVAQLHSGHVVGTDGNWAKDVKLLQPGDLIFYQQPGASGPNAHVVMYIGNGQVIEAPSPGHDVRTMHLFPSASADEPFFGVRRYLPPA